jgi:hypothetical protein
MGRNYSELIQMSVRTFGGKQYQEANFTNNKKNADILCAGFRASGFLARAVKVKNGYVIYTRKA